MNRPTVVAMIMTLLLTISLFGQERTNRVNPFSFSKKTIGELKTATGWFYDDGVGKWVSKSNIILNSSYDVDKKEGRESLGLDNFVFYQLREVQIEGKDEKYIILMEKYTRGEYKYVHIEEGWRTFPSWNYWIFPGKELDKFVTVKDGEKNLITIDAIHAENVYGKDSIKELRDRMVLSRLKPATLYVQIFPFKKKNLVQFLIFGKQENNVFAFSIPLSGSLDDLLDEKIFDKYYYETGYKSFTKLFNIDSAD